MELSMSNQPLPPMPPRITHLRRDHRGFPVPWFVQWFAHGRPSDYGDGTPDFRVMDGRKLRKAISAGLCWVCGGPTGKHKAFMIGPMCAVNRVTAEPPCHRECAEFSAMACPFLTRPRMRRNEHELPKHPPMAGFGIMRNPGVACVWITNKFKTFKPHAGGEGVMFQLGDPYEVLWYCEGRTASRAEVLASIDSGFPILADIAKKEGEEAMGALMTQRAAVARLLPMEV